jgi:dihydrofolate reductase
MGRGTFGPQHGPWPDQEWTGWWGDTPPFRTPVLVLTHHLRPPVRMNGGTTSGFPGASPVRALARARRAAAGADVRIGGGPSAIGGFLAAGLIGYAHIVVVPIVLGRGDARSRCHRVDHALRLAIGSQSVGQQGGGGSDRRVRVKGCG